MIFTPWGIAIESDLVIDWPQSKTKHRDLLLRTGEVNVSGELLHMASDVDAKGVLAIFQHDKSTYWTWRQCCAVLDSDDGILTYDGPRSQLESFLERVVLPTWMMTQPSPPLVLHASAVISKSGQTFGLLGPSGTGKSSTALALAQFGFQVITDDMLVLKDAKVMCASPAVRLCGADAIDEDYPGSKKRRHPINPPLNLGGPIIWVDLARGEFSTRRVSGIDAFRRLGARRFDLSEWSPEQRAHQFEMITETTRATIMLEFVFPTDSTGLPTHVGDLAKTLNEMDP